MSPGEPACPLILPVQKTETTSLFTEQTEQILQSQHYDVRVLNAGVNGYSVTQTVNRRTRHLLRARFTTWKGSSSR